VTLHRWLVGVAVATWLYAGCSTPERTFGQGPRGGNTSSTGGRDGEAGSAVDAGAGGAQGGSSNGAEGGASEGGAGPTTGGGPGSGGAGSDECTPDQRRCNGDVPEACDADGNWERTQAGCAFGCTDGVCNLCEEETTACEGGDAKVCVAGQWQYTLCDQLCEEGACVEVCEEEKSQCNGLFNVETCTDGVYVDTKECPGVCSAGECVGDCRPDSKRCKAGSSNLPEVCSASGEWGAGATCEGASPICLNGACVACEQGDKRCSPEGRPQLCTEFGSWEDQQPCGSELPACVAGECRDCAPSSRRCSAGNPQLCDANGSWDDQPACAGATPVCVAATGICGTCTEGDVQCGDEKTPQKCQGGKWVDQAACSAVRPVCLGGVCAECAPNDRECVGTRPRICSNNGSWVAQESCMAPTPQCVPATGECGCPEGNVRCLDSNTPQQCSANGSWVDQTDCAGDTPICKLGKCHCTEGARECTSSTGARVCQNGAWVAEECSGTTPVCAAGKCAVCSPGSSRCVGLRVDTCSAEGAWVASETCSQFCTSGRCTNPGGQAGIVGCNPVTGETCKLAADEYCCYSPDKPGASSCVATRQRCNLYPMACDGPSDCKDASQPVCCVGPNGASCQASCPSGTSIACDPVRPACNKLQSCGPQRDGPPNLNVCSLSLLDPI